jgi:hypothetical protein
MVAHDRCVRYRFTRVWNVRNRRAHTGSDHESVRPSGRGARRGRCLLVSALSEEPAKEVPLGALEVFDHRRGVDVEFGRDILGRRRFRDLVVARLPGRLEDLPLAIGQFVQRVFRAVVAAQSLEVRRRAGPLVLAHLLGDGLL